MISTSLCTYSAIHQYNTCIYNIPINSITTLRWGALYIYSLRPTADFLRWQTPTTYYLLFIPWKERLLVSAHVYMYIEVSITRTVFHWGTDNDGHISFDVTIKELFAFQKYLREKAAHFLYKTLIKTRSCWIRSWLSTG